MSTPGRICSKCGNPLLPTEVYCSNCGERYFEPTMLANSSGSPYTPPPAYQGQQEPSYGSSDVAPTSYGAPPYGQPAPGEQVNFPPPPPASNPRYSTPAYVPPSQPGSYPPPGNYPPPGGYPAPRKKGPKIALIIGIVVLVLVLACAVLLFAVAKLAKTADVSTPTPTVVMATPTTQVTTPVLFSDTFSNNAKGWATNGGSGFSRTIGDSSLTLFDRNHKTVIESLPTDATYDNFAVTTTFTFVQGDLNDSLGVYYRGDSNLDHDYRVDIFGDNSYMISKDYLDNNKQPQVKLLMDVTHTNLLNPQGQQNKMTIVAKGNQMVLLINDKVITSVSDTDYNKGQIALFVQNGKTSRGAKGSFSSITVKAAPDQVPAQ